jgi:hypothetical protein
MFMVGVAEGFGQGSPATECLGQCFDGGLLFREYGAIKQPRRAPVDVWFPNRRQVRQTETKVAYGEVLHCGRGSQDVWTCQLFRMRKMMRTWQQVAANIREQGFG